VYQELQDFVQLTLREPLRKATKNKKDLIRRYLLVWHMLGTIIYVRIISI